MAHSKTTWATGNTITADKLNNAELQYDHVVADAAGGSVPVAASALTGTIDGDRLPNMSTSKGGAVPASTTNSGTQMLYDNGWGAIPEGGEPGASGVTSVSMIVTNESGTYKCYTGLTGAVVSSSATAATVIQYAIDNLTSGRTWKERVVIKGNITLTTSINLASYLILQLDGKIKLSNNAHCPIVENSANVTQVEICGGDWDGNLTNDAFGGSECRGITIYGDSAASKCSYVHIHDLTIHDIAYDNIACMYCNNVVIRNCHIYNAGDFAQGASYWGHGLGMYYSTNCILDHCHIEDCASGGCYFYCEDDATVQTVNNNQITNNLVERTYTSGISFARRGAEDVAGYDMHEGNTVIDCGIDTYHPGINLGYDDVTKALHCIVDANIVYCNGAYTTVNGISIAADYSTISNNIIHDIDGSLILVEGNHNLINGNILHKTRDAASAGIYIVDGSYNNVCNNTIYDVNAYGIAIMTIDGAGCIENWLHGNLIDTVDGDVVGVTRSTDLNTIIEDNYFRGTPLTIDDRGTGTILRRNTGYVTEKAGTAVILNGQTHVHVTHSMGAAPTKVTATGSTADTASLFVDTIGATEFIINAAGAVGGNRTVYWRADV
jgi:hypothetical protein